MPMWAPRTPLRSHPATDKAESAQIPTRLAPRATQCSKSWSFRTVCKTFLSAKTDVLRKTSREPLSGWGVCLAIRRPPKGELKGINKCYRPLQRFSLSMPVRCRPLDR